ncbi:MAG: hypothetical protein JNM93_11440 [Bacteriovoracaceae bacterium]|nr:hypothetical protein [Bacteriovoracaceae bacterium]
MKHLVFFSLVGILWMSGCNQSTDLSGVDEANSSSNSCTAGVIDGGTKFSITGARRGEFSDTKMNPLTNQPATAYFDLAALAIKYSYWNGSQFVHELVAGYPATVNSISLTFLTNGRPVIAWTAAGTDVMIAGRSLSTATVLGASSGGTQAKWRSTNLTYTGAVARTVEIAANPGNQVGGVFLTNTAATGRPVFLFCSSNCHLPANYSLMAAGVNIENTNIVAAQVGVGFAWCGVDADANLTVDSYYPAVAYSGNTNAARYAVCDEANVATCLATGTWAVGNVLAASSNLINKLYLDPTVVGDVPKVVALKAGVGIKTYEMGTTACTAAPAAFTESAQTIGGTTSGNLFIDVMKDSTGKFHIVANETTTSVRYYNSIGTPFTGAGTWNTAGTLNTSTVLAGSGGADIDRTNNKIYSTHLFNIGAYQFNMLMNVISDITVASSSGSLNSSNYYVNTQGHMSVPATATKNIAVDKTSENHVGVAYVDYSTTAIATGVMKYAYRNGTARTSAWSTMIVPGVTAPTMPSLRYDHLDRPWIGYFDQAAFRYTLVTNSEADGTGTWSSYLFPTAATATYTLPATTQTAIAMYPVGSAMHPVLIVIDPSNSFVRAARFNSTTNIWTAPVTIEALAAATDGSNLVAREDEIGNIGVAYADRAAAGFVRYNSSTDGGVTWGTSITVSAAVAGMGNGLDLAINPVTQSPVLSYVDRTNNRLYVAECSGTVDTCDSSGWSPVIQDFYIGVSGYTGATNDQYISTSGIFQEDGTYDVLYGAGMLESGAVKRKTINVDDTVVSDTYLESAGGILSATFNFGVMGSNLEAVLVNNQIVMVYLGDGNLISHYSCGI